MGARGKIASARTGADPPRAAAGKSRSKPLRTERGSVDARAIDRTPAAERRVLPELGRPRADAGVGARPFRGCEFIEGDPKSVRRGIDPHCGAPVKPGSSYCPRHHRRCWIKPEPALVAPRAREAA
jgi:hypothetical protein